MVQEYKLDDIIDDLGRQIHLTYNAHGLLSTITDFAGRTWTYTLRLRDTTTCSRSKTRTGRDHAYTYDYRHNLTTITDPNGQTFITNEYHPVDDRVLRQTYGYGMYVFDYNAVDQEAVATDREGYETKIVYSDKQPDPSRKPSTRPIRMPIPNSFTTRLSIDPVHLGADPDHSAGRHVRGLHVR